MGDRVVGVVALAAVIFIGLAVTGTLPLTGPTGAGATQYCTQYQYGQYGNSCTAPLLPPLIAFHSTRDGGGNTEVYVMNTDGSTQTRLWANNGAVFDGNPSWSPNGQKLAFASLRNGNLEVYTMNVDGNGQTRLTTNPAVDTLPAWSPDGSKIAFQSSRDNTAVFEIYVMNADGSGQTRLTNNPAFDAVPTWSPDARKIAFTSNRDGNTEIYVMNADGSAQTRLTNNPATDNNAAFSPDGTKIAFVSTRDGNGEIYVMNADGSGQTRLTNSTGAESAPTWSPDGTKIAFQSNQTGNLQIYVMNADGSGVTRLTSNTAADSFPNWQRDVPGAPTGVTAVAGDAQATVSFTAPASTGGAAISSYTATAAPGGAHASGSNSPITVAGLTNGTAYTFTVRARNGAGTGPASSPSGPVTPQETTPPVVTATDLTVDATSPSGATVAGYPNVTAVDEAGGSGVDSITCTPPPPHLFPIGDSTVSCTATDKAGNTSAPVSFGVHVTGVDEQLTGLGDLVSSFDLGKGLTGDLLKKIDRADKEWTNGETKRFCARLDEVAQRVLDEVGHASATPTISQARSLLAALYRIETVGECIAPSSFVPRAVDDVLALIRTIDGLAIGNGLANDLRGTARDAGKQIASADKPDGCKQLAQLVDKANAETGKKLTQADASAVISAAGVVQDDVGCS